MARNAEAAPFLPEQIRADDLELEELLERMKTKIKYPFALEELAKGKPLVNSESRLNYIKYVDYP